MYVHGKGKNRAEEMILLKKFPSLRMFYYACHFSDLTVWWNLENPETLFIPSRTAFCFVTKDAILKNIEEDFYSCQEKRVLYILLSKGKIVDPSGRAV
jgi:hypothetical protein